jgi:hypothetical protein
MGMMGASMMSDTAIEQDLIPSVYHYVYSGNNIPDYPKQVTITLKSIDSK